MSIAPAPSTTVPHAGPESCTGARTSRPIQLDAVLDGLNLTDDERRYLACYRYRLERIIADLPDLNGRDVLDLGCNTGFMMALFRHLWPKVRLVGCDVCRPYVIAGRRRGFRTLMCNLQKTEPPLAADSFDVAFAGEIIEMLDHLDPLFEGIQRVLRPGGRLFAQTYNLGCLSNRLNLLRNRPIFLSWTKKPDTNLWRRAYLRSELQQVFVHYGFVDIRIDEVAWWSPKPLRRLVGRAIAAAGCSLGPMFMIQATKPG